METIGHLEWSFGIFLVFCKIWNLEFSTIEFILFGFASLLPDLIDLLAYNKELFHKYHRVFTHTILFLLILISLSFFSKIFLILAIGTTLHFIEDWIGGGPIYITPGRGKIILLSEERIKNIGIFLKPIFDEFVEETQYLPSELSWFFLLTIIGSFILGIGFIIYLW